CAAPSRLRFHAVPLVPFEFRSRSCVVPRHMTLFRTIPRMQSPAKALRTPCTNGRTASRGSPRVQSVPFACSKPPPGSGGRPGEQSREPRWHIPTDCLLCAERRSFRPPASLCSAPVACKQSPENHLLGCHILRSLLIPRFLPALVSRGIRS